MTQECASFFIAAHPVASAFPFGEGGPDRRSVTDEAAHEGAAPISPYRAPAPAPGKNFSSKTRPYRNKAVSIFV